jgi:hypothetical protein
MCQTPSDIRENDYVCITLDKYIKKRQKDENDDAYAEFDILRTEAEIANRICIVQIKQDLSPLAEHVKSCNESPSLSRQLKNKLLITVGKIAMVGFFMFMAFYTFVEVVGYAEALAVFK